MSKKQVAQKRSSTVDNHDAPDARRDRPSTARSDCDGDATGPEVERFRQVVASSDAPTESSVRIAPGRSDDPLLTEEKAAEYLKISRRTLQRYRQRRRVRYIAYSRQILYRRSFLDDFVAHSVVPLGNPPRRKKRKKPKSKLD